MWNFLFCFAAEEQCSLHDFLPLFVQRSVVAVEGFPVQWGLYGWLGHWNRILVCLSKSPFHLTLTELGFPEDGWTPPAKEAGSEFLVLLLFFSLVVESQNHFVYNNLNCCKSSSVLSAEISRNTGNLLFNICSLQRNSTKLPDVHSSALFQIP